MIKRQTLTLQTLSLNTLVRTPSIHVAEQVLFTPKEVIQIDPNPKISLDGTSHLKGA